VLPQASEPAHQEEVLERLARNVAAGAAILFGNPVQLAPDALGQADGDGSLS
jgi:hypothetical protein